MQKISKAEKFKTTIAKEAITPQGYGSLQNIPPQKGNHQEKERSVSTTAPKRHLTTDTDTTFSGGLHQKKITKTLLDENGEELSAIMDQIHDSDEDMVESFPPSPNSPTVPSTGYFIEQPITSDEPSINKQQPLTTITDTENMDTDTILITDEMKHQQTELGKITPNQITKTIFEDAFKKLQHTIQCDHCKSNQWTIIKEDQRCIVQCKNQLINPTNARSSNCPQQHSIDEFWCSLAHINYDNFIQRISSTKLSYINITMWKKQPTKPNTVTNEKPPNSNDFILEAKEFLSQMSTNVSINHTRTLQSMLIQAIGLLEQQPITQQPTEKTKRSFASVVRSNQPIKKQNTMIIPKVMTAIQAAEQKETATLQATAAALILKGLHPNNNLPITPRPPTSYRMPPSSEMIQNPLLREQMDKITITRIQGINRMKFTLLKQTIRIMGFDPTKIKNIAYRTYNNQNITEFITDKEHQTELLTCLTAHQFSEFDNQFFTDDLNDPTNLKKLNKFLDDTAYICNRTSNLSYACKYQQELPTTTLQSELIVRMKKIRADAESGRIN
ncbi:hypothetical protein HDV02_004602, partial [Globomyces sp. JEL0801]